METIPDNGVSLLDRFSDMVNMDRFLFTVLSCSISFGLLS